MYGLRHKRIRIEDQQLNLKINIMSECIMCRQDNISNNLKTLFNVRSFTQSAYTLILVLHKHINYLAKVVSSGL
jgi:hypothetical protein